MQSEKKLSNKAIIAEQMARLSHKPFSWVMYSFPWGKAGTELADDPDLQ